MFQVRTFEEGQDFLELVNGKYKGKSIVLKVHDVSYTPLKKKRDDKHTINENLVENSAGKPKGMKEMKADIQIKQEQTKDLNL